MRISLLTSRTSQEIQGTAHTAGCLIIIFKVESDKDKDKDTHKFGQCLKRKYWIPVLTNMHKNTVLQTIVFWIQVGEIVLASLLPSSPHRSHLPLISTLYLSLYISLCLTLCPTLYLSLDYSLYLHHHIGCISSWMPPLHLLLLVSQITTDTNIVIECFSQTSWKA